MVTVSSRLQCLVCRHGTFVVEDIRKLKQALEVASQAAKRKLMMVEALTVGAVHVSAL